MRKFFMRAAVLLLASVCLLAPAVSAAHGGLSAVSAVGDAVGAAVDAAEETLFLSNLDLLAEYKAKAADTMHRLGLASFDAEDGSAEWKLRVGAAEGLRRGMTEISRYSPASMGEVTFSRAMRINGSKVRTLDALVSLCAEDFDCFCMKKETAGVTVIDLMIQEKEAKGLLSAYLWSPYDEDVRPVRIPGAAPETDTWICEPFFEEERIPKRPKDAGQAESGDAVPICSFFAEAVPTMHYFFAETERGDWKHVYTAERVCVYERRSLLSGAEASGGWFQTEDALSSVHHFSGETFDVRFETAAQIYRERRTAVTEPVYGFHAFSEGAEHPVYTLGFEHPETPGDLYDAVTRTDSTPAQLLMISVSVCVIVLFSVLMMHRTPKPSALPEDRPSADGK